jgi:hypothetical protein
VLPVRSILMSVTYTLLNYFATRVKIMYPIKCQSVGCTIGDRFLAREANVQRRQYRSPPLAMSWASSIHLRKWKIRFPRISFALFSCLPLGVATFYEVSPQIFGRHLLFPHLSYVSSWTQASYICQISSVTHDIIKVFIKCFIHFMCKYFVEYLNLESLLFPVLSSRKARVFTTMQNHLQK